MAQRKDIRLPLGQCHGMTLKQIRSSIEYKSLTPLGKKNTSGSYRYGNKSYLRKAELCKVLDNPSSYHSKVKVAKKAKKNLGPRKRKTRKGDCLVAERKIPCNGPLFKHKGLTTTGEDCCFKRKQSKKVTDKRRKGSKASSGRKLIMKGQKPEDFLRVHVEKRARKTQVKREMPLPPNLRKSPVTPK